MTLSYAQRAERRPAARRDDRREPAPDGRALRRPRGARRRATSTTGPPTASCGSRSTRAARALLARGVAQGRPRRHLGAEPLRVGGDAVRHRPRRRDPRHHQPRLQDDRAGVRARQGRREPARHGPRLPAGRLRRRCSREVRELPSCATSIVLEDDWEAFLAEGARRLRRRAGRARGDARSSTTRSTSSTRRARPARPRARRCRTTTSSTTPTSRRARCATPSATACACRCRFYHCFGMVLGSLALRDATARAWSCPASRSTPRAVLEAVAAERCTSLYGVPTMFIAELEHPDFERFDLSSLRTGIMAGAPCPVEVMKQVRSRMHMEQVTIVCGMTETSPVSTQTALDDPLDKRVETVGRVHPHVEVKIVDPETGAIVPRGVAGRAVHARLQRHARLLGRRAGDRRRDRRRRLDAQRRPRGHGRRRLRQHRRPDQGHDHPRRREHLPARDRGVPATACPRSATSQVIGVPSERYGEEVMAWVKLRDGAVLTEEYLVAACRGRIATLQDPALLEVRRRLPDDGHRQDPEVPDARDRHRRARPRPAA